MCLHSIKRPSIHILVLAIQIRIFNPHISLQHRRHSHKQLDSHQLTEIKNIESRLFLHQSIHKKIIIKVVKLRYWDMLLIQSLIPIQTILWRKPKINFLKETINKNIKIPIYQTKMDTRSRLREK